jgi:hypothetical protein
VEAENLPDFLGGKCKCAEFGGCMKSGAGPWNDFEITLPIGIKKKQLGAPPIDGQEEEKTNHY